MSEKYSPFQLDMLKEIINIGGGNAATSIAKLVGKRIEMDVPVVERLNFTEVFSQFLPEDTLVKAVLIEVSGAVEGIFLYVTEMQEGEKIIDTLLEGRTAEEPLLVSALCEFVNILANSYLNAVSQFLEVEVMGSVPLLVEDMFGALLTSAYLEEYQFDETLLIIKNEFYNKSEKLEFSLYFIPRAGNLSTLLQVDK